MSSTYVGTEAQIRIQWQLLRVYVSDIHFTYAQESICDIHINCLPK